MLGIGVAVWAGTWFVADTYVGHAMKLDPGPEKTAELEQGFFQLTATGK